MILPEEHHAKWLAEVENGDLKELLTPFPAERIKMWPISSRVNSPDNNDEALLEPVEPMHSKNISFFPSNTYDFKKRAIHLLSTENQNSHIRTDSKGLVSRANP